MERPVKFEHVRFLGDKRTQLVYDLDEWDDPAPIDESARRPRPGICFGPDTLAEARNRGYTLARPAAAPPTAARAPERPGGVNGTFTSNGLTLARHLVVPTGRDEPRPGVILCHGFPIGPARRPAVGGARSRSSSTASPTTSATPR